MSVTDPKMHFILYSVMPSDLRASKLSETLKTLPTCLHDWWNLISGGVMAQKLQFTMTGHVVTSTFMSQTFRIVRRCLSKYLWLPKVHTLCILMGLWTQRYIFAYICSSWTLTFDIRFQNVINPSTCHYLFIPANLVQRWYLVPKISC